MQGDSEFASDTLVYSQSVDALGIETSFLKLKAMARIQTSVRAIYLTKHQRYINAIYSHLEKLMQEAHGNETKQSRKRKQEPFDIFADTQTQQATSAPSFHPTLDALQSPFTLD